MSGGGNGSPMVLANKALELYLSENYDQSLKILRKISKLKDDEDIKVSQNIALVEYKMGGCKNPKTLLAGLDDLSADDDDMQNEDGVDVDDCHTNILRYNQAVLLMQCKRYASATEKLQRLYQNIDTLDDRLAFKIIFLLMDLYLLQKRGDEAAKLLRFLSESDTYSAIMSKKKGAGRSGMYDGEGDAEALEEAPEEGEEGEDGENLSARRRIQALSPGVSQVQFKFALHLYRTKLHLLRHNLKSARKEIKSALQHFQREAKASEKLLAEAKGKSNKEKAAAKARATGLTTRHTAAALFLKSNLEYLGGNYRKAIKLLNSCQMANGATATPSLPLYFNNLGCIHYRMRKTCTAGLLFNKALAAHQLLVSDSSETQAFAKNRKAEILYNCGVQAFINGSPELACVCYQGAARICFNKPSLWLRMAECCVAMHVRKLDEQSERLPSCLVKGEVGSGARRRLLLVNSSMEGGPDHEDRSRKKSKDAKKAKKSVVVRAVPKHLSMEFALKCLRNCLYLLNCKLKWAQSSEHKDDGDDSDDGQEYKGRKGHGHGNTENKSAQEPDGWQAKQHNLLSQACLLNFMYVSLCLNNPVVAVRAAEQMLGPGHTVSPVNKLLTRMYAAEALCMLNRPDQAKTWLTPPSPDEPQENLYHSPESATSPYITGNSNPNLCRLLLFTNIATVFIAKGQLNEAHNSIVAALKLDRSFAPALRMLVYLHLRNGNYTEARRILKERRHPPPYKHLS